MDDVCSFCAKFTIILELIRHNVFNAAFMCHFLSIIFVSIDEIHFFVNNIWFSHRKYAIINKTEAI